MPWLETYILMLESNSWTGSFLALKSSAMPWNNMEVAWRPRGHRTGHGEVHTSEYSNTIQHQKDPAWVLGERYVGRGEQAPDPRYSVVGVCTTGDHHCGAVDTVLGYLLPEVITLLAQRNRIFAKFKQQFSWKSEVPDRRRALNLEMIQRMC